jgi:hypothetical protein
MQEGSWSFEGKQGRGRKVAFPRTARIHWVSSEVQSQRQRSMASYAGNPRITIDSEADWTRIKDNFTSALLAQIDAKLDPNEDDESREKLREELVRRCMQVRSSVRVLW